MRKIRDVLRLKHAGKSHRFVATSVGISPGSVSEYVTRAKVVSLTWTEAEAMTDAEVERRLFQHLDRNEPATRAAIDLGWVHAELRRAGVTLQLLWTEYSESAIARGSVARPYGYSQFCEHYVQWHARLSPVMRQVHRAGEKGFVDYSGKRPSIIDATTGERTEVELFLMVLGASNFTFVEATRTQQLADFIGSHVRAFEFFEGAPEVLVPDQLRSAVSRPDRYEPEENPTYAELAKHYGAVIIPARPRKPKDKAKVEVGVQIAQRWILARLRNEKFFSLGALNVRIVELRDDMNTRPFQKLEGCRRSLFERYDKPALKPLPAHRFEICEWKTATVNIDYHFGYDDRFYSVPCALMQAPIMVRATATTVEALHNGARVASHLRSYERIGFAVTDPTHRPRNHREYGAWPPERMIGWAGTIGPAARRVVESILAGQPHPEKGYRSCLALTRDSKHYGVARTEAACVRALAIGSPTRKSVVMILKRGLDRVAPDDDSADAGPRATHENVRGGDYFDTTDRTRGKRRGGGGSLH